MHERQHVLQLIAEAERAARLVERRPRPRCGTPASGRAASGSASGRSRGRAFAPCSAPSTSSQNACTARERSSTAPSVAVALDQRRAPRLSSPASPRTPMNTCSPRRLRDRRARWIAPHGSSPAPTRPDSGTAAQRGGRGQRTVAAEELRAIAGDRSRVPTGQIEKGDARSRTPAGTRCAPKRAGLRRRAR